MAVFVVGIIYVLDPFLQLTVPADLVGCDFRKHLPEGVGKGCAGVQERGGIDAGPEQRPDDLVVHGRPGHQSAVFRRVGGAADEFSRAGIPDQEVGEELRGPPHDGVGPVGQELPVLCEEEVLPEMKAQPGPAGDPDAMVRMVDGRGAPPGIGIVVQDPPRGIVMLAGRHLARLGTLLHQPEEGLVAFR